MAAPRAPQGWTVELLGIIGAVQFTNDEHGRRLTWSDGQWYRESRLSTGWMVAPAPGVGTASTMQEARAQGCAFLHRVENEAA